MRAIALSLAVAAPLAGAAGPAAAQLVYTPAAAVKASGAEVPAVGEIRPAGPTDEVTQGHMLLQAGKTLLFGHADTREQAAEAAAHWTALLKAQGVEVGALDYKDGFFTLPYKTADGRVIRHFLADARQFPPKDEAGLRANMADVLAALTKAGLTPVAAKVVKLEYLLPTYSVLYLTTPNAAPELETRLRLLQSGEDVDASVFSGAGLTVVQTPKPWLTAYIGPEAGYVSMLAGTAERAEEKRAARETFLRKAGKRILASKVSPVDLGEYKFFIEIYFVADRPEPQPAAFAAPAGRFESAALKFCRLRTVEKDVCVYSCTGGTEYRMPARDRDPNVPNEPVLACPQIVFPF